MNIFVLDSDPRVAARVQCDKHVVKMLLESAQLLSGALRVLDPSSCDPPIYRLTHVNHPASLWTRASLGNFEWLLEHADEQRIEYIRRYGKIHRVERIGLLQKCSDLRDRLPPGPRLSFVFCGDPSYLAAARTMGSTGDDAIITAYKLLYLGEKSKFARWRHACSPPPFWWSDVKRIDVEQST